jgi:hypothetical protein
MAKKQSNNANRSAYASTRRFASDNRRALGIVGAGLAGAAALFLGRRYRDRQAQSAEVSA